MLGELDKYVALSAVRWLNVSAAGSSAAGPSFCLQGSGEGEAVTVTAVEPGGLLREETVKLTTWSDALSAWTACGAFGDQLHKA